VRVMHLAGHRLIKETKNITQAMTLRLVLMTGGYHAAQACISCDHDGGFLGASDLSKGKG
jgi:hypothetical protein